MRTTFLGFNKYPGQNEEPFKPLPIAASRTVKLGGTVATVGFPDIGLQRFALKVLAHGHRVNYAVKNGRAVLPRRPFINRGGG